MTKPKVPERASRPPEKPTPAATPAKVAPPAKVKPLFRKIDWLTLVITMAVTWVVYLLTLAPELTLEDSGELVTGSYYAGIPHPPGYPVWTLYSWLWTVLVPVGNPAWRVALAEAFSGSLACGLIGLMVSRGSSMLMEGIEALANMKGKWESGICMVSGIVAGLLVGLDGFMWRESVAVNRIAVSSVPWFMLVLLCLLRWLYAPHQYRFLYWALFLFGICFTTHQSLIVAAMGLQVLIAAGRPRVGRDIFLWNSIIYSLYFLIPIFTGQKIFANIESKPGLFLLFNLIGVSSIVAACWLSVKTKKTAIEYGRDLALFGSLAYLGALVLGLAGFFDGRGFMFLLLNILGIAVVTAFVRILRQTWQMGHEWLAVVIMGLCYLLGISFYLYLPISGMTNPPMQWGYPRTVEGFFHALTRGQYGQPDPTNIAADPFRFIGQLWMLVQGLAESFTWVGVFIAIVPFFFFRKMQKREQAFLIGLSAIYLCLGVLLMILLNPTPDRASADLVKVFFNSSHTVIAGLIGYGLALTSAFMATHYEKFRRWGFIGGGISAVLACYVLWDETGKHYFGPTGRISLFELPHWISKAFAPKQFGLPIFANVLLVLIVVGFILGLVIYRRRAPLAVTLGLFLGLPLYSGLAHWFHCDQRNHMFGYWFGHDMFTPPFNGSDGKPIYPEMTKDAILYGGTDPGRFCPTYMVFCESFTPHNCQPKEDQKFDRRDVYIITQNALADGTYLNYIRAHYNRSKQIDPPFFQELLRSGDEKHQGYKTNLLARLTAPLDTFFESNGERIEKRRRTYTSWFTSKDFTDLPSFTARLRPGPSQDPLSKYLYDHLSAPTRQLLSGGDEASLRRNLAEDLNRIMEAELKLKNQLEQKRAEKDAIDQEIWGGNGTPKQTQRKADIEKEIAELLAAPALYEPERFKHVALSEYLTDFIKENPQSHTRIRLNRLLLEAAYSKEIAHSIGGVYPDREIYISTPEDLQKCFEDYSRDAARRKDLGQLRPGEEVNFINGQVQVAGTLAVFGINALVAKNIFDHNPKNEFFVEESFPLDWMYPHLTPYGVIMKVNRQPVPTFTEDIVRRDHEFWKQFSKRLTGDFIDYDTPVKQVVDWIEKTYLRGDFNGFTGDRKFVHDEDGQKAFSKLRSSIGGIYSWRISAQCPPELRPKSNEEYQRILKEADFTYRQAFAFCPYSPEAVFRYVQLLADNRRLDDAILVGQTSLKFDPNNGQIMGMVESLKNMKKMQP